MIIEFINDRLSCSALGCNLQGCHSCFSNLRICLVVIEDNIFKYKKNPFNSFVKIVGCHILFYDVGKIYIFTKYSTQTTK